LLERAGVRFVRSTVAAVDPDERVVRTDGEPLAYDRLVLAAGSSVERPGSIGGGLVVDAGAVTQISARLAALPRGAHVAIVGGGLTGVETAAEISERFVGLRVSLYSRGRLLSSWSRAAGDYVLEYFARHSVQVVAPALVSDVREQRIETTEGDFAADVCIFAAGFVVSPLAAKAGLATDPSGKALVDPLLRSISDARIYVVGDLAAPFIAPRHPLPMGCKAAQPTGVHAAESIVAEALGREPSAFDFATPFYCVSLGRREGLLQFPGPGGESTGRIVTGRAGAWLKEFVSAGTWWSLQVESFGVSAVQWRKTAAERAAAPRAKVGVPPASP
jgi:NADH dehydrogenase FAD-containing subunit